MKRKEYRKKLIDAIVRAEVESGHIAESDYPHILRHGFKGYKRFWTRDLERQFCLRWEGHPELELALAEQKACRDNKKFTDFLDSVA